MQQHGLSPQQRAAQLGAVVAASCGRQGAIPVPLPPSNPVVATVRSIVGQVRTTLAWPCAKKVTRLHADTSPGVYAKGLLLVIGSDPACTLPPAERRIFM